MVFGVKKQAQPVRCANPKNLKASATNAGPKTRDAPTKALVLEVLWIEPTLLVLVVAFKHEKETRRDDIPRKLDPMAHAATSHSRKAMHQDWNLRSNV